MNVESFANDLGMKVRYKDQSALMKIIAVIIYFFNPKFMTSYVTTIGRTVYFPSRKLHDGDVEVIAHEARHVHDWKKYKLLFQVSYLFPQILALLALLTIPFVLFTWWGLLWLIALIFLAPIPAPWRKHWEYRGYEMSLFFRNLTMEGSGSSREAREFELARYAAVINKVQFKGPGYYWMWPQGVDFSESIERILAGDISETDEVFSKVVEAYQKSKSV